jgi:hypothetical protein
MCRNHLDCQHRLDFVVRPDPINRRKYAKLYDRKTQITVADRLNNRVVPFFDEKEVRLSRITDRARNIAAILSITNMSFISRWKTSAIRGPRQKARRRHR